MRLMILPIILPISLSVFLTTTGSVRGNSVADKNGNCKSWAEMGECENNPGWMDENCAKSCKEHYEEAVQADNDLSGISSFFDLEAKDIDGQVIDFDTFRGKVTVVVNVASFCGYTKSHYRGLVELHKDLVGTDMVEILAFPCNQFGAQEPEECPSIKRFAAERGVEFTMMDKVEVNGPGAHPVYRYLKKTAGPARIEWNFATYFVVSPDGSVQSFSGVEPKDLKDVVLEIVDKEL